MAGGSKRQRAEPRSGNVGESSGAGSSGGHAQPTQFNITLPHAAQRTKLAALDRRAINPTLFYSQHDCYMIGIDEKVRELAVNLGFDAFLDCRLPNDYITADTSYYYPTQPPLTYRPLTLEFLASFELNQEEGMEGIDAFKVKFRLFNKGRHITLRAFNELFGWDPNARILDTSGLDGQGYIEGYSPQEFWARITSGAREFQSNSSKASEIHHAALRYFHRMLAYIFFSRKDLGKMSDQELYLLWRATEGALLYPPATPEHKINLGYLFAKRCKAIRDSPLLTGPIFMGGMVTYIAFKYRYKTQLQQMESLNMAAELNIEKMKRMQFISDSTGVTGTAASSAAPPVLGGGEPSSSSAFNIEQAFASLTLEVRNLAQARPREREEAPAQSPGPTFDIYQNHIYDYHVDQGHFSPCVNYPYYPPQHGPVPNWEPPQVDDNGNPIPRTGGQYPYWQGPGTLHDPPHSFPPYNYQRPGGCDYLGDPAYPYQGDGFPPGYYGGWEPYGPPCDVDYDWAPPVVYYFWKEPRLVDLEPIILFMFWIGMAPPPSVHDRDEEGCLGEGQLEDRIFIVQAFEHELCGLQPGALASLSTYLVKKLAHPSATEAITAGSALIANSHDNTHFNGDSYPANDSNHRSSHRGGRTQGRGGRGRGGNGRGRGRNNNNRVGGHNPWTISPRSQQYLCKDFHSGELALCNKKYRGYRAFLVPVCDGGENGPFYGHQGQKEALGDCRCWCDNPPVRNAYII
uniref:Arabidopsis retrotransposon Orf1 C-terminal domain-containing protein n=1 Tax=Chenopodium quinoa TaxID=63459 RepID=A0A803NE99_CHEQI